MILFCLGMKILVVKAIQQEIVWKIRNLILYITKLSFVIQFKHTFNSRDYAHAQMHNSLLIWSGTPRVIERARNSPHLLFKKVEILKLFFTLRIIFLCIKSIANFNTRLFCGLSFFWLICSTTNRALYLVWVSCKISTICEATTN